MSFLKNLITATTTTEFTAANVGFWNGICYLHFVPKSWANEAELIIKDSGRRYLYLQAEVHPSGEVQIYGLIAPCAPMLRERLQALVKDFTILSNENGYATFYGYPLRFASSGFSTDDDLVEAWQEWVETEGSKFTALIKPGDFPAA